MLLMKPLPAISAVPLRDDCASEPIHIPGSIQPHGLLLTLSEPTLDVLQASTNVNTELGLGPEPLSGQALGRLIGEEALALVRLALADLEADEDETRQVTLNGDRFEVLLHRHQGLLFLELYRLNWIRVIPDAAYTPVPILPALRPDNGQPLDLSFAVLRSVSPVHCHYLKNMGVRSSMSISLLKDGALWGLITCGHREPLRVPHELRVACISIGQLLSMQITVLQEQEARAPPRRRFALCTRGFSSRAKAWCAVTN